MYKMYKIASLPIQFVFLSINLSGFIWLTNPVLKTLVIHFSRCYNYIKENKKQLLYSHGIRPDAHIEVMKHSDHLMSMNENFLNI